MNVTLRAGRARRRQFRRWLLLLGASTLIGVVWLWLRSLERKRLTAEREEERKQEVEVEERRVTVEDRTTTRRGAEEEAILSNWEHTSFSAFLSHFKIEAATEARWLKERLEVRGERAFLDSDDLQQLNSLHYHVRQSRCVVLLQTANVFTRPWCLLELVAAVDAGVPIVGVSIASGAAPYSFNDAQELLTHLDTALPEETARTARAIGVDLLDAAFKLSSTLPRIISIPFNAYESQNKLAATVDDIVEAMGRAQPVPLPDRDEWLRGRGAPLLAKPVLTHGPATAPAQSSPARVPAEVPELPKAFLQRGELDQALRESVLSGRAAGGATTLTAVRHSMGMGTTTASGMGGVGKTMAAAALCREPTVVLAFEVICWVSVGQEPDLLQLQRTLHMQLTNSPLAESTTDPKHGLAILVAAAKGRCALLVIDDVWESMHLKPLSCVDVAAGSALVVTTRVRSLVAGATELQCDLLSPPEALALLLRAGGVAHLLDEPPPAALRAVELCGRLPLALEIAGGIIAALPTSWEDELLDYLREEMDDASVEERVVSASLRAMPQEGRVGVESLFVLFAIVPEDAIVPAVFVDCVAPLTQGGVEARRLKLLVRRQLQQLLQANLLRGSLEDGISVHDLVRDCMLRRAEGAREGGLRAFQRAAVPLLLAAFDAGGGVVAGYVARSLHWHVRQAAQEGVAVYSDAVLMRALCHEDDAVRAQAARGVGSEALRVAVGKCEADELWLKAAQLHWAAAAKQGGAAGTDLLRAHEAFRKLREIKKETAESRRLELRVLSAMSTLTEGGYAHGSAEHSAVMERLAVLSRAEEDDRHAAAWGEALAYVFGQTGASDLEGGAGKPEYVHTTVELLERSHEQLLKLRDALDKAAAAAPSPGHRIAANCVKAAFFVLYSRQHRLPGWSWDRADLSREALLELIDSYDAAAHHAVAKSVGFKIDFMCFGLAELPLLLRWGDVAAVRGRCVPQLLASVQRVAATVRRGDVSWSSLFFETFGVRMFGVIAPLLLNDRTALAALQEDTLHGLVLRDAEAMATFSKMHGDSRPPDAEGYCAYTLETHLLHVRCLGALVEPDSEASRSALRSWLPLAGPLLRIARYERYWDFCITGPAHPSLLAARLHCERLGDHETAAAVARGMLDVRVDLPMHPLARIEALRLLACATADADEAWAALEQAETEAAEAGYAFMEALALRDMLRRGGAAEARAAAARRRLDEVRDRLCASRVELDAALGLDA